MPGSEFDALWKDFAEETLPLVARFESALLSYERELTAGRVPSEETGQILSRASGDLHTIKGNCGMMGLSEVAAHVHQMEDDVRALEASPSADRIDALLGALDKLRSWVTSAGPGGSSSSPASGGP